MKKESRPITYELIEELREKLKQLPPKPTSGTETKLQAVAKLKESIVAAQDRGYSYAQIAERLSGNGLSITPRTLQAYMRKLGIVRRRRTTSTQSPNTTPNTTSKKTKKQPASRVKK